MTTNRTTVVGFIYADAVFVSFILCVDCRAVGDVRG